MHTINIFISYSSKDRDLKDLLKKGLQAHLSHVSEYTFNFWTDDEIELGTNWKNDIDTALSKSHVCLALVSANFADSEYCTKNELGEFFKNKNTENKVSIIPVLVRSYDFKNFEYISSLQFFKTYNNEYGFNKPIERNNLLPFDKLADDSNTTEKQLNDYYDKLARKIHSAIEAISVGAHLTTQMQNVESQILNSTNNLDENTNTILEGNTTFSRIDNYKLVRINGEWHPNKNIISFIKGDNHQAPVGACLAPVKLNTAVIEVEILFSKIRDKDGNILDTSAKILFNHDSKNDSYYAIGIGGYNFAFSLIKFSHEIGGWEPIKYLGSPTTLVAGQVYKLKAFITGKSVELHVDNVSVLYHDLVLADNLQIGLFAWGNNPIEFRNFRYKILNGDKLKSYQQKQLIILNFFKGKGIQQYSIDQITQIFKGEIPFIEVNRIIIEFVNEGIFKKQDIQASGYWFIQNSKEVNNKIEKLKQFPEKSDEIEVKRTFTFVLRNVELKEIDWLYEEFRNLYSDDLMNKSILKDIYIKNPDTIKIIQLNISNFYGNDKRSNNIFIKVGCFEIFPLKSKSIKELFNNGMVDGRSLRVSNIKKKNVKSKIYYIGSVGILPSGIQKAIENKCSEQIIRSVILSEIKDFFISKSKLYGYEIYTRPVTKDGLKLVKKYKFIPANKEGSGLNILHKIFIKKLSN